MIFISKPTEFPDKREGSKTKMVPVTMRPFGQASLPSSFRSKSSSFSKEEDKETKPSKQPISLSDFLNRKIGKPKARSIQEKQSSFSSIGSERKDLGSEKDEKDGGFILDKAVFQRFNPSVKEESQADSNEVGQGSRKRKNPFGVPSANDNERPSAPKYLVVLGDDPKPKGLKPKRRREKLEDQKAKPLYNHYEWDGGREGVDSEEVGCNEIWEGMGSTSLGGLEWH